MMFFRFAMLVYQAGYLLKLPRIRGTVGKSHRESPGGLNPRCDPLDMPSRNSYHMEDISWKYQWETSYIS